MIWRLYYLRLSVCTKLPEEGVQQSNEEAVKWFRLAADQGLAEAQYNLGVAYSTGNGVKLNKATAKAWYQKACANGYKPACDVLKNKK